MPCCRGVPPNSSRHDRDAAFEGKAHRTAVDLRGTTEEFDLEPLVRACPLVEQDENLAARGQRAHDADPRASATELLVSVVESDVARPEFEQRLIERAVREATEYRREPLTLPRHPNAGQLPVSVVCGHDQHAPRSTRTLRFAKMFDPLDLDTIQLDVSMPTPQRDQLRKRATEMLEDRIGPVIDRRRRGLWKRISEVLRNTRHSGCPEIRPATTDEGADAANPIERHPVGTKRQQTQQQCDRGTTHASNAARNT